MIKINVKMDMLVYLGISIPNRKKIVMYQNCYDYVKSKSGQSVSVDRKVKGTKMCIIKPKIKFRTTKGTRRYQSCDKVAGTSCTCIH